ncbi:double-strand break repair protein AddB [Prosthecomicrobium pneumaticum]|uniref:ATP-dependent helicase/nuclease subunit B n=1 Tax=Prosthecomicrobium pneumaticum TaxID=81895 RepID=A0A7W9FNS2_9HYPH|nr:double-strand break repair protein AddB [Prosthecomicrobium pneumaticum]MBB5754008.1 ATP-dependent helicase/nuclease subunit B [Prosthecomicrobium pneumaticum]
MSGPRVFTIPAGVPFLDTLVDALFSGRLGPVPDFEADPLALADVTLFLPTRRAARALAERILARLGGRGAILPRIRPIGDADEEEHLLTPVDGEDPDARLALPLSIGRLERQLILARLVLAWGRAIRAEQLRLAPDEPVLVAASAADALRLAGDLARLIDDVETAGLSFDAFAALVPEALAGYFQITLDFLKIVAEAWPAILAERGLADPAVRRDRLIREEAARLAAAPPRGLVVAAGSTGSIPATASLLATIARLPNGAVVLPGLDTALDEAGWAAIGAVGTETSAPGHPHYALKQLLAGMGVVRRDVVALAEATPALAARAALLSEAMRPAETTEAWAIAPAPPAAATQGIALLLARTEQEEALAIAVALREAIATEGRRAALVTPDRTLARRVAAELARFGISADDSGGRPLSRAASATFLRLLVAAAASDGAALDLLALTAHPFAAFGFDPAFCRRAGRRLELLVFRGRVLSGGLAGLVAETEAALADHASGEGRLPRPVRRLGAEDRAMAADLAARLAAVLAPLALVLGARQTDAAAITTALLTAARAAADTGAGDGLALFGGEEGEALAGLVAGLAGPDGAGITLSGPEYPGFLAAAMEGVAVPGRPGADPRIAIWGTLEARLQSVDTLVLGGLDEGVWPAETRTDPFLSRPMRAALGLEPPERRIGQSAHDFLGALGTPDVILTRSEKRGGSPTLPARWLQRLDARLGEEGRTPLLARGARFLAAARRLDTPAAPLRPALRPRPAPPVAARPRRLSVTEIETLVRDPYAIYAKHVLGLDPLDPLGVAPDAAARGTLIHAALAEFAQSWNGWFDARAERALIAIGERHFRAVAPFPDIHALWWPRFRAIARWYVGWEAGRAAEIAERHAEIAGDWTIAAPAGPFRLTGRADRIDLRRDGTLDILDFKTGAPPSARQLSTGLAPQLALEVAMARAGAFGSGFAGRTVATLGWIGLGRAGRGEPFSNAAKEKAPDALGAEAARQLAALVAAYDDAGRAYLSRARPMFERRYESPYDHLARVREWMLGGAEEEP